MAFTGSSVAGKENPTVFIEIAIVMLQGRVDRSVDIFPTQPVVSLLFLHWGEAYKSYRGKGACWSLVCTPLLLPPPQDGGAPVCYLALRPISSSASEDIRFHCSLPNQARSYLAEDVAVVDSW